MPGGLLGGLRRNGLGIALGAAFLAAVVAYQARRRPLRVRAHPDGLRFNWRRTPIPWTDVASVEVGVTGVVWALRDGSTAETSMPALGARPEDTVLAARRAIAALRQSA
jgi:hypothetical protein